MEDNEEPNGYGHMGLPMDAAWNWPEDYEHENGQYIHKCSCGRTFHGYKRRQKCKLCVDRTKAQAEDAKNYMNEHHEKVWSFMGLSGDAHKDLRRKDYEWGFVEGWISAMRQMEEKNGADQQLDLPYIMTKEEKDQQRAELRESALDHMGWSEESNMGELYTSTRESMVDHLVDFAMSEMPSINEKSPSDPLRDKKAGWQGLANIYEIIRGSKCDETVALGMATSAASELKRKMDEVNEALRWRDPEKELPLDPLTRCEVLSNDQAFIAWLGEDDGPTYWILVAPMESKVGDVVIPNVIAWRPASIATKVLNPPLSER